MLTLQLAPPRNLTRQVESAPSCSPLKEGGIGELSVHHQFLSSTPLYHANSQTHKLDFRLPYDLIASSVCVFLLILVTTIALFRAVLFSTSSPVVCSKIHNHINFFLSIFPFLNDSPFFSTKLMLLPSACVRVFFYLD